ncbi:MAG: AAA family ATPase [Sulfolobales archaeon]|nr:AAA family ATPase [Sulfolobales archaeon]
MGELEKLVGRVLSPYVMLITGNPGSGKTTLASTICYKNALIGRKCLYVTFYEQKESFFRYMKNLGMDFESAGSKGLLSFIRVPVVSNIDAFVEALTSLISSNSYRIVVIDSINPLFEILESRSRRAWLTNFFYNLAQVINGLVVLVAELPYGLETSSATEFVADAVIVLKQSIEDGFLVRFMEIRKARGIPVTLAEIPFFIEENVGLRVWVPPVLSEVSPEGEELVFKCEALRKAWTAIRRGEVIYVTYPPDCRYPDVVALIALQFIIYGMKLLVVSYRYPPNVIEEILVSQLVKYGVRESSARELLRKYLKVVSINPFSYSVSQLVMKELEIINSEKSDVVVFHGIEVARAVSDSKTYIRELFNEINYLKNRKIIVVRLSSHISDEVYRIDSSLTDAVIRVSCEEGASRPPPATYLWRKMHEPHYITVDEIRGCAYELVKYLSQESAEGK